MCSLMCSVVTVVVGCILVIGSSLISFLFVPGFVDRMIINEVVLINDTIQYERFEEIPFPLEFRIYVFEITNPDEVMNGHVPIMNEIGPYVYKMYQTRNITYAEGDVMRYRRVDHFEFDAEASYPHTEDDMVNIINVPYHAIIQIAEQDFPALMPLLYRAMDGVFGDINSPIVLTRVGDLFFKGIDLCINPGLVGSIACNIVRDIGGDVQNLEVLEDGSVRFSLLDYKNNKPSPEYEISRGLEDPAELGLIRTLGELEHFLFWVNATGNDTGICNMINGTDSGIFAPFVDREQPLYAINTDVCRTVELRYQYDLYEDDILTAHYSANEWFLDNNEGCYCLNTTAGINRDDGCLLAGAMELYTCVGAMLVLTYPHFLYADWRYRNGVLGMAPNEENHRIFIDIEPNTGTPIRGAKRAQFNIFQKPVNSIPTTANLRTTLVPIVWIEEGVSIPEEFKDELRTRLIRPLNLLDIAIPVLIAVCCLVLLVGLACVWRERRVRSSRPLMTTTPTVVLDSENKN